MSIWQHIMEALESLLANKLRSSLTMLGIVIGVAAVISMLAIGNGAQNSITSSINDIGANLIFVSPGARGVNNPKPLTLADAEALTNSSQAPSIAKVAPVMQGRVTAAYSSETSSPSLLAVTPVYADVRKVTVAEGSFINNTHVSGHSAVAVIGSQTASDLFGRSTNVVGLTMRINSQPFKVIGVLTSKGGSSFGSQDDQILIPLSTGQSRLLVRSSRDQVDQIYVEAKTSELAAQASTEITRILQIRHRTAAGANDFSIMKQEDMLSTVSTITGTFTIFLGGIAGIALLVGGIGIMNIMLVSVTERTREIGLRKAVGARRKDILLQFLIESSVISLIGGGIGILMAWGISIIIGKISAAANTPIQPVIGLNAVLMATLFSAAIGLFFGIYPASRAAALQPVEALRSSE